MPLPDDWPGGRLSTRKLDKRLSALEAGKAPAFTLPRSDSYLPCADTFTTRSLMGIDRVDNRMLINNSSQILQSSDDGATLSTNKGTPAGMTANTMRKVVRFKGKLYLSATDATGPGVFSTDPQPGNTAFAWTREALTMTAGAGHIGPAFTVVTDAAGADLALLVAEYSDPAGGPSIYRSTDGDTWQRVAGPVANLRHFHAVAQDPYHPAHVYATAGDGLAKQIWESTDYGTTWSVIGTDPNFQAVQVSFTAGAVWFAGDSQRGSVFVMDRATKACQWLPGLHRQVAVPNPLPRNGGHVFTDAATTNGSKTVTSATAGFGTSFDKNDVGREIVIPGALPPRTYITGVASGTSVQVSNAAVATLAGQVMCMGQDQFYWSGFYGVVDPATGFFYFTANDNSSGGNRSGLFVHDGQRVHLLESFEPGFAAVPGAVTAEHFIYNGRLWVMGKSRPLLSRGSVVPA